jgi:hypothetical protein
MIAVALWLLSGCGGGGGTGGSGGGSSNLAPGQYIEFLNGSGGWMDPLNLTIGASGTAVLANYDALGTRSVLPPVGAGWQTTAAAGAISINSATGFFTVIGAPIAEFKFQTTTTIFGNPTLFEQRGRVPTATPIVNGRFTELNIFTGLPTGTGIAHLNVDFFNAGGTVVGSARTMADGRFTGFIPTTATHMMIESDSIRTSKYYRSVYYQGDTYSPLDTTCRISVAPIGAGTTNLPTGGVPLVLGSPPPPPTGCT